MSGILYIVGTPIGNLGDISPRALKTLGECDFIAAEDTRVTLKLLTHFGIKKPLLSYYEHNSRQRGCEILERLLSGESCALVSDAGMPVISDPGEELVRLCHESGVPVAAVPGPSALITALAMSGMSSGRFTFEGFLTTAKQNRQKHLNELKNEPRTMIFYESPHKLPTTLFDMLTAFGDRELTLVREITKVYETVERTTLLAASEKYKTAKPKGEYVLILAGKPQNADASPTLPDALTLAARFMEDGLSLNEAAKAAAAETGIKKSDIYRELTKRS